ncbi:MAG: AI-2E family transporter [Dehalococcoidia bacterium]|nr:AI-2E family transporter [Dehalococcoidia bacterium]
MLGATGDNVSVTNKHWRILLWASMLLFTAWVVWSARIALLPFAFGAVVAYALSPVVDRLASLIPARTRTHDVLRRGAVVLVIYLVFFGALGGIGVAIVPTAVDQASQFIDNLPDIVDEARIQLTDWADRYRASVPNDLRDQIDSTIADIGNSSTQIAGDILTGTFGSLTSAIGLVSGFLIIPFWLFYALRDRHFIERNFMRAVPEGFHDDVMHVARISDSLLGRYIRAQLLLGLVVGTAVGVSLTFLGVQFSVGLGLWAGITEMIPVLGPWLGGIPGVIIVLATQPDLLFPVMFVYFIVQQLENNLLVPRIQGDAVDIHPAMVIMLLVVFGAVWGLIGMIVAVPFTAIVRELFWYADRRLRGATPDAAFAASHVGSLEVDLAMDARLDSIAARAAEDASVAVDPENDDVYQDGPGRESAG